jgi:hypothetical protein
MTDSIIRGRSRLKLFAAALVMVTGVLVYGRDALSATPLPEMSPEGLKLVPKTKASAVYLREGASFKGYDKVAILDCYVAFRKDWQRDQNRSTKSFRVSDEDMTRIKTELADLFKEVFTKELTAKGEKVVTGTGQGVLILRPAIVNLDVQAPDTMEPGVRTYSTTAGQATLYLEIYDSVTSELLARVLDVESPTARLIGVRNGVTNRADAEQVLTKWASLLGTALQTARGSASAPAK